MNLKRDSAVSPVVAMMLILAVVTICASIVFATYVPDMKENSEIIHSKEVKEEFLKFSSDVDNTYINTREGVYTYVIPLGGGDTMFSPSRSAGTINISIKPVGKFVVNGEEIGVFSLPEVSYTPLLSFWENQGYLYKFGRVYVTKNDIGVPALAYSGDEYANDEKLKDAFLTSMAPFIKPKLTYEATHSDLSTMGKVLDQQFFTIPVITFETGNPYTSGNGDALVKIEAKKTVETRLIPMGSRITFYGANDTACAELTAVTNATATNDPQLTIIKITAKVSVQ